MKKHLSMLSAWGLSFGYAVGWGAFVMPGAEFLPSAGPLGTVIGIAVGAAAMAVIGWNYHRMVSAFPGPGGAYAYARNAFGADYGYLTAWSLTLAYMAILWANATALVLLARYMFGDILQFGWHDTLAGFDIYLGEVLLSVAVMVLAGCVCLWRRRLAGRIQAALALFMLAGVSVAFFFALSRHEGGLASMAPAFASGAKPFSQVLRILAMMPWAFVGFEAVSHSSDEFAFGCGRLWKVLAAAILASVAMYAMLALLPVLAHPEGYLTWADYITGSVGLAGLDSMPTFAAARIAMGNGGVALLGGTMFAAIFTGIVGATVAMSRLLCAISADGVFPRWRWLGRTDRNGSPRNAVMFVVGVSLAIPFFGRTVIGWPVEVSSIGAAVAYCYTSAAAFKFAKERGDRATAATGLAGVAMSVVFCLLLLVPNYISGSALSAESYLVLALWCIVGFALYWYAYRNDTRQRFGRSPVVWTGIVVLVFFSSLMWVRLATQRATGRTVEAIVG
ncbi:MAG: APC family permease [Kiritimatiellae bacterium]|nr:APC family permease [Kiritimatiellia bacterium]